MDTKSELVERVGEARAAWEFRHLKQGPHETIHSFYDNLRRLASRCGYKDQTDHLIRDQMIFGLRSDRVRWEALEKDLQLKEIVSRAIDAETFTFDSLPREILLHIFNQMSAVERNHKKDVCSLWKELVDLSLWSMSEFLPQDYTYLSFICTSYDDDEFLRILGLLCNPDTGITNLRRINFNACRGDRLQQETIRKILELCPLLEELSISKDGAKYMYGDHYQGMAYDSMVDDSHYQGQICLSTLKTLTSCSKLKRLHLTYKERTVPFEQFFCDDFFPNLESLSLLDSSFKFQNVKQLSKLKYLKLSDRLGKYNDIVCLKILSHCPVLEIFNVLNTTVSEDLIHHWFHGTPYPPDTCNGSRSKDAPLELIANVRIWRKYDAAAAHLCVEDEKILNYKNWKSQGYWDSYKYFLHF